MPLIRKSPDVPDTPRALDLEAVRAELRAPGADARWRAARVLSGHPDAVGPLADAAEVEGDSRVLEAIFTGLARIGTPQCVAVLASHLRSDDADRRTAALDSLRTIPRLIGGALAGLLEDEDSDVRLLACDLARELPPAEAAALLVRVLEGDAEINVCAAAVDVLAEVGSPGVAPALRRCAERFADPFLDFAVGVVVDRLGEQAPLGG